LNPFKKISYQSHSDDRPVPLRSLSFFLYPTRNVNHAGIEVRIDVSRPQSRFWLLGSGGPRGEGDAADPSSGGRHTEPPREGDREVHLVALLLALHARLVQAGPGRPPSAALRPSQEFWRSFLDGFFLPRFA